MMDKTRSCWRVHYLLGKYEERLKAMGSLGALAFTQFLIRDLEIIRYGEWNE